jgi:hypothetical protein
MIRVALFNDTGWYPHIGCRAVSAAHDRMLARAGAQVVYRSRYGEWTGLTDAGAVAASPLGGVLRSVDAVVVNGEGTIHHGRGRHLLTILRAAQALARPTLLVNAVLQACDEDLDVLARLTDCTVRDAASSAYLARHGVSHRVVFDSILEAPFGGPVRLGLHGDVVITDWHGARADVGSALQQLMAELGGLAQWYPLEERQQAAHWSRALADIREAGLVVTGRHHGICLAAMAGVPFVACGSNTWKVEGLLDWMPGGLQVWRPGDNLRAMCDAARDRPDEFRQVQEWVLAQQPLTTFAALERVAV